RRQRESSSFASCGRELSCLDLDSVVVVVVVLVVVLVVVIVIIVVVVVLVVVVVVVEAQLPGLGRDRALPRDGMDVEEALCRSVRIWRKLLTLRLSACLS
ncbi:unnamed protein product, partial [Polarella glacialis]